MWLVQPKVLGPRATADECVTGQWGAQVKTVLLFFLGSIFVGFIIHYFFGENFNYLLIFCTVHKTVYEKLAAKSVGILLINILLYI